ncbi:MAG: NAD(P)-dependent oxidoreductase [Chloroflexi bacterium]|nr:NAD(P)-dependent oxidoreductase [Chloroflexota bacterium]
MKILLTGHKGQLGTALVQALASHDVTGFDLPELDITNRTAVQTAVLAAFPELIIHCAAYTDVDGCARNPELAYRINGLGTQNVALAAQEIGAEMLHISSNEVFAGDRPSGYDEWMPLNPVNGYGRSKAAAEFHVKICSAASTSCACRGCLPPAAVTSFTPSSTAPAKAASCASSWTRSPIQLMSMIWRQPSPN